MRVDISIPVAEIERGAAYLLLTGTRLAVLSVAEAVNRFEFTFQPHGWIQRLWVK
jgi:hypothetical protein